jgi:hypothetical protein
VPRLLACRRLRRWLRRPRFGRLGIASEERIELIQKRTVLVTSGAQIVVQERPRLILEDDEAVMARSYECHVERLKRVEKEVFGGCVDYGSVQALRLPAWPPDST